MSASILILTLFAAVAEPPAVQVGPDVDAENGAVVSVCPIASEVGARVLSRGGHAVDAAVATALALAVTWPEAGNLGGGGFMLVRESSGEAAFVDYREMAPGAARADMFLGDDGGVDPYHVRRGYRPVGVPGTVAGLALAHERYGRLPWEELVGPAIELAESGFVIDDALHRSIAAAADELSEDPEARRIFLTEGGRARPAGGTLVQADLARSLRSIAEQGADAFYRGDIARRIVAASQAAGGPHTLEDFAAYRAKVRPPLRGSYRGFEILAGPPPTSGGQVLIESLNILEGFDLPALQAGSAAELHLLGEALRRAFFDRALYMGDADFARVDVGRLISKPLAADRRRTIDPERASRSDDLAGDMAGTLVREPRHTTHFSVIDGDGNAVANTYTLEESWGAKLIAPGTGIVLNNEMHDFNVQPGVSTRSGRIGTAANTIAPGKRPLSSMCPAMLLRNGELVLIAGSPGGRTIPSTVLRLFTAVADHALGPREAVELARVHHGLFPDRLLVEERAGSAVIDALRAMGHEVSVRSAQGDAHAIGRSPATGALRATADRRRRGAAAAPGSMPGS